MNIRKAEEKIESGPSAKRVAAGLYLFCFADIFATTPASSRDDEKAIFYFFVPAHKKHIKFYNKVLDSVGFVLYDHARRQ